MGIDRGPTIAARKTGAPHAPTRPGHQTRERAKHLLVHRANGGIHNAAIALKLATAPGPSPGEQARDAASFVAVGIRGTANAARALQLLGALVGLESGSSPTDGTALVDDIIAMLRTEARRRGITLQMDFADSGPALSAISARQLAEALVAGLSAVERASPNSALTIRARRGASSAPDTPLALQVETAAGDARQSPAPPIHDGRGTS